MPYTRLLYYQDIRDFIPVCCVWMWMWMWVQQNNTFFVFVLLSFDLGSCCLWYFMAFFLVFFPCFLSNLRLHFTPSILFLVSCGSFMLPCFMSLSFCFVIIMNTDSVWVSSSCTSPWIHHVFRDRVLWFLAFPLTIISLFLHSLPSNLHPVKHEWNSVWDIKNHTMPLLSCDSKTR